MKNLIWEYTVESLKFKTLAVNGFQIFGEIEFDFVDDDDNDNEGRYYFCVKMTNGVDTSHIESGAREIEAEAREAVEKIIQKHIRLALQAYSRLMFEHFEEPQLP
jgi:hypothetical protein